MNVIDRRQELMPTQKMKHFPASTFVGPYEREQVIIGMFEEQWLWQNRDMIRGLVVDMSTPQHFHEYLYTLPTVQRVLITDLDQRMVEKLGYRSRVDIVGDFCTDPAPMPPQSADTILCLSVMEHVEDPFALMRNLAAILRPGGHLFIWTPFAYTDGHMGPDGPDFWRFGRDAHLLLAKKAGLETVDVGQFLDLGPYFEHELGRDMSAKPWNRGVPVANWSIHRKQQGNGKMIPRAGGDQ